MFVAHLIGIVAILSPLQQFDTTLAVPAGARIEIENLAGDVIVRTWDRNAVRVTASGGGAPRTAVRLAGAVLRVETDARRDARRPVDYALTIPATAALRVTGPFNDVSVDGAGGDVSVETVRGDVSVRGGNGAISLSSVQGSITLERARGRIRVSAVNDDIRVSDTTGDIVAEGVNGSIVLQGIESNSVEASTVNGSLSYDGTIRDGGRYRLTTHNGRIALGVPDRTNATFSVATFNGEIDSALPLSITQVRRGERFTFTLGSGSARVDLESFNGTIQLRRPGGARNQEDR